MDANHEATAAALDALGKASTVEEIEAALALCRGARKMSFNQLMREYKTEDSPVLNAFAHKHGRLLHRAEALNLATSTAFNQAVTRVLGTGAP